MRFHNLLITGQTIKKMKGNHMKRSPNSTLKISSSSLFPLTFSYCLVTCYKPIVSCRPTGSNTPQQMSFVFLRFCCGGPCWSTIGVTLQHRTHPLTPYRREDTKARTCVLHSVFLYYVLGRGEGKMIMKSIDGENFLFISRHSDFIYLSFPPVPLHNS